MLLLLITNSFSDILLNFLFSEIGLLTLKNTQLVPKSRLPIPQFSGFYCIKDFFWITKNICLQANHKQIIMDEL